MTESEEQPTPSREELKLALKAFNKPCGQDIPGALNNLGSAVSAANIAFEHVRSSSDVIHVLGRGKLDGPLPWLLPWQAWLLPNMQASLDTRCRDR